MLVAEQAHSPCLPPYMAVQPACMHITEFDAYDQTKKQSVSAALYSCAAALYANTRCNTCDQWEGPSVPAPMYSCTAHLYAYIIKFDACDKMHKQCVLATLYSCAACLYANMERNTCNWWDGQCLHAQLYNLPVCKTWILMLVRQKRQFLPAALYSCTACLYGNIRFDACDKLGRQSMPLGKSRERPCMGQCCSGLSLYDRLRQA